MAALALKIHDHYFNDKPCAFPNFPSKLLRKEFVFRAAHCNSKYKYGQVVFVIVHA